MAEIAEDGGGGHKKGGKKRAKKQSTKIDMTPMVDLAFLLLTFFVLTSTFSKPKSMELTFPAPPPPGPPVEIKNGITFILTKDDRIFYYKGEFRDKPNDKGPATELQELNFSQGKGSLHQFLADETKGLHDQVLAYDKQLLNKQLADTTYKRLVKLAKSNKDTPTFLIKTDDKATYKDVIDLIDELNINIVGKYVVTDLMKGELDLVNAKTGG
ncbi:MAG: biopolymer transporter ExbD [Bacteroidetes bacterium]|nr:biopolymer transporter ExbD [Bacteroidota bacterium]